MSIGQFDYWLLIPSAEDNSFGTVQSSCSLSPQSWQQVVRSEENDGLQQVGCINHALFHCFPKVLGEHERYSRRRTSAAGFEDSVKMFFCSKA